MNLMDEQTIPGKIGTCSICERDDQLIVARSSQESESGYGLDVICYCALCAKNLAETLLSDADINPIMARRLEAMFSAMGLSGKTLGHSAESRASLEFSDEANRIMSDAFWLALAIDVPTECHTAHLLGGLLRSPEGRGALLGAGISEDGIREAIATLFGSGIPMEIDPSQSFVQCVCTKDSLSVLQLAENIARDNNSPAVGPEHLVYGLIATNPIDAVSILLLGLGADRESLAASVAHVPSDTTTKRTGSVPPPKTKLVTNNLDRFGRSISKAAEDGLIDPVIGRESDIADTIEILARRRKNNAILIGEPGVGKTAIAEGLALRILENRVPEDLKNCQLYELSMSSLVAGTTMRGSFEKRLNGVLSEVKDSKGQIILFIDEMHTVLGAGNAMDGTLDAASILKPMLARGELHVIGATTLAEYKHIERDGAFARRFSTVLIEEPSIEDTVKIIIGLKGAYEDHHKVTITDEAIAAAATLSARYITDHFLPDKAIDLIDQASARVRLRDLRANPLVAKLEKSLAQLNERMHQAAINEDFEEAASLQEEIAEAQAEFDSASEEVLAESPIVVERKDVADVIARRTQIPLGDLLEDEIQKLATLEEDIHVRLIGQDSAVETVSDAVRRSRAGLGDPSKPIGTFLFLGPTGVGKTELAKVLALRMFGKEEAMIRIDMSEYREQHSGSRLIGSPPGYVGHGAGGQLTEKVRRQPYSVILLDEIEKAHPDVLNLFLPVFDDGRLTDGEGVTTIFRNCVIIMTSNAGAAQARKVLGFGNENSNEKSAKQMTSSINKFLAPEFRNRIDEIVIFDQLDEIEIASISEKICSDIALRIKTTRGIDLIVDDDLITALGKDGFDAEFGARPLARHIQKTLEKRLTSAVLSGEIQKNDHVRAGGTSEAIEIEVAVKKPAVTSDN